MTQPFSLAVALDGAGWHPAAWREPEARPTKLFTGSYWRDLVRQAEAGGIDLVTIEDALGLQTDGFGPATLRNDRVTGRLDALLLASWLAPATKRIGLVPTVTTTHTEPFHVSTAIASLDYASRGRAGWRVQVSGRAHESAHFGRKSVPGFTPGVFDDRFTTALESLFGEAADSVEVVRGLWDSWEDDAEIRDVVAGRFLDNTRVHPIHFSGDHFSVRGPSITPRPPQGQPPVFVLAHQTVPYRLAAGRADVVFITPHDEGQVDSIIAEVRDAEQYVERTGEPVQIWADVIVAIDETRDAATARLERLNDLSGSPFVSDAVILTGSAQEVADRLLGWHRQGIEGFRLRPLALPHDLVSITERLVPILRSADVLNDDDESTTLRSRLGLGSAINRFATALDESFAS
jgi:alkanesulfonate monooxygenase SsuD/methylene tetrahydromethanopterin reductase-like flavin-dependent oxidoreductase (luciferase family)